MFNDELYSFVTFNGNWLQNRQRESGQENKTFERKRPFASFTP
jgi:hypothetical protein